MASWQPDPAIKEQIIQLCTFFINAKDSATHKQVFAELEKYKQMQDYSLYLSWVFFMCPEQPAGVRQMAGTQLKEFIRKHGAEAQQQLPELITVIKDCTGQALKQPHEKEVRLALSSLVTTIVTTLGVWPQLLQALAEGLSNQEMSVIDLSMSCLVKIAEDTPEKLDEGPEGQTALDTIMPMMIQAMDHKTQANFRVHALNFINHLLLMWPVSLAKNLQTYLQKLFALGNDPAEEVRTKVFIGVAALTEERVDVLEQHLPQVLEFVLTGTKDPCVDVQKEATEFWSILVDVHQAHDLLGQALPHLLPVLINNMAYHEDDDIDEGEDESVPDTALNMRPRNYTSKDEAADDEDDEESDDDDDDDDEVSEWTLRKSSATALDLISNHFHDDILPILLPIIDQMLNNQDWRKQEAGVLALGAISEGCILGMKPHLPAVIPQLFRFMEDQNKPLLKSISCWTVGRYATWAVQAQQPDVYLAPLMTQILQRIQDKNKKVQAAACAAFALLTEEAQGELIPYLPSIIQHLMFAYGKYQAKNLNLLMDTLSALADSVGAGLAQPELVKQIIPPIVARWEMFEDTDERMFPLFECLTSLCQAVGTAMAEWAGPMFGRCCRIIHTTLAGLHQGQHLDQELIVCSLDLVSAIIDGLAQRPDLASELVGKSNLMALLLEIVKIQHPESCQSAFALVGDMTKTCLVHLGPSLPTLLPLMVQSLNPQHVTAALADRGSSRTLISLSNNACWAIGEMAKRCGPDLKQFYPQVLDSLVECLVYQTNHTANAALMLNMTICLGRISLSCADLMAPKLDRVAMIWCFRICRMRNDVDKEDSCTGLCNCIALNAAAIVPTFVPFLVVVNSWHGRVPPGLRTTFTQLLEAFTQNLGMPVSQWLAKPDLLQNLSRPDPVPKRSLTGLAVLQAGIGWDEQWQQRCWCPNIMAKELAEQGYMV